MAELKENLKAWKDSGSNLSFSEWKLAQGITQSPERITPISNTEIKPKRFNSSKGREAHIWLDSRVHEKIKGLSISGQINKILRLYYGIPESRWGLEEIEREEKEEQLEKAKMEELKKGERQNEQETI